MTDSPLKILVIENQQFQFIKIAEFLHDHNIYPREEKDYILFIDNVRVWVNKQYGDTYRKDAFQYILDKITTGNYDLILMDHILGGAHHCLTGINLAKEINKTLKLSDKIMPVAFLSKSEHTDKNRLAAYDEYCNEFPNSSTWLHKGYFGDEILKEDYFKGHILSKLPDLIGLSTFEKVSKKCRIIIGWYDALKDTSTGKLDRMYDKIIKKLSCYIDKQCSFNLICQEHIMAVTNYTQIKSEIILDEKQ